MISHDLHLVMAKTDKVICINHHICCSGEPQIIASDPAYLALFGQQTSDSLAVYNHSHQGNHGLSGYPADETTDACCSGEHTHGAAASPIAEVVKND
jgi:zinc transport system ATP-binding protein